ncbi:MAG: galactokinase [Pseudomonadota bacterium]|jgi:D-glycero-alpha-D-manno-heptose-7-phosphate kinase
MISTRTPLRVTLGGGGTDLESYYRRDGGFIFAMALDKYIHISAHRPAFHDHVALMGPDPENVARTEDLKHELVRAALLRHGIETGFEAASIGDIVGGTGLGSSSCFLVGFLRALHALKGHAPDRQALAEEACDLEINVLAKGIGKQDQYMAAFGGLTTLDIAPNGEVRVGSVALDPEVEAAFIAHTHIYYTGLRRDAAVILDDQNSAMLSDGERQRQAAQNLGAIKDLGYRIRDAWVAGDLAGWGRMLHEHWVSKKQLSSKISWPHIDQLYDHVRANLGVTGGKVIGAGGGGFLMLFTPNDGQALEDYMASQNMPRLRYGVDRGGTQVLLSQVA